VHGVHEAFSASDVIAYPIALKEVNPESQLSRLDSSRQAGRAASDNTDPGLTHLHPYLRCAYPLSGTLYIAALFPKGFLLGIIYIITKRGYALDSSTYYI
jgi:hypothetical protein